MLAGGEGEGGRNSPSKASSLARGQNAVRGPAAIGKSARASAVFLLTLIKPQDPPPKILQWYVLGIWVCWRPGCSRVPGYTRVCPGSGYTQTSVYSGPGYFQRPLQCTEHPRSFKAPFKGPLKAPYQRDPEVFFWPSVFLEAWSTKAKTPHIFQNRVVLLAGPPSAARPTNHSFLKNMWICGLGTQGLQKPSWLTKPLRDPFEKALSTDSLNGAFSNSSKGN